MKTAISLPDKLFEDADAFARHTGVSRSELYATAIAEYLARRSSERITARLNAVYGAAAVPASEPIAAATRFPASRADLW
jgi:metal-responsive CopG/Arc/MetJ family transcriptional regulator